MSTTLEGCLFVSGYVVSKNAKVSTPCCCTHKKNVQHCFVAPTYFVVLHRVAAVTSSSALS